MNTHISISFRTPCKSRNANPTSQCYHKTQRFVHFDDETFNDCMKRKELLRTQYMSNIVNKAQIKKTPKRIKPLTASFTNRSIKPKAKAKLHAIDLHEYLERKFNQLKDKIMNNNRTPILYTSPKLERTINKKSIIDRIIVEHNRIDSSRKLLTPKIIINRSQPKIEKETMLKPICMKPESRSNANLYYTIKIYGVEGNLSKHYMKLLKLNKS